MHVQIKIFVRLAVLLPILSLAPMVAPATCAMAKNQQPSPQLRALTNWLREYNRADPLAFERFAASHYSSNELAERSPSEIADGAANWFHNFGEMRIVGPPTLKPAEAETVVYLPALDACARLFVEAEPATDKIGGVYLEPFAAVDCGETKAAFANQQKLLQAIRAYIDDLADAERFSGTVLIARRGKPLLLHSRGDARAGVANGSQTRFELASIAKLFTAVAVGRLVDRGQISLDDTVGELLPTFKGGPGTAAVTVRHLLAHTSGIPDYYRSGAIFRDPRQRHSLQEFWPLIEGRQLKFSAGTEYDYSNSNYVLLGSIVESVSNQTFPGFVRQEIFRPAAMRAACYCSPAGGRSAQPRSKHTAGAGPERRAIRSGWRVVPDSSPRPATAAGHALSTVWDLAAFGSAWQNEKILSPALREQFLSPVLAKGSDGKVGLGFELDRVGGLRVHGHSGHTWGAKTQLDLYPDLDLVVVVLSNVDASGTEAIRHKTRQWIASVPDLIGSRN